MRKTIEKTILLTVLLAAVLVAGLAVKKVKDVREKAEYYQDLAYAEKDWIMANQLPDGAVAHTDISGGGRQTVSPYFSASAVRGLLAGSVSPQQARAAEKWLNWYLDRLNTQNEDSLNGDGTIYDYSLNMENGEFSMESTGQHDSVDSYAALFLIALEEYSDKCGTELLINRIDDVERVIAAMLRTVQDNGLSIAKQEYKMQYLMDNAELSRGLSSAQRLLELSGAAEGELMELEEIIRRHTAAFEENFWNTAGQYYDIAVYEGSREEFRGWEHFYPDGAAQLFPIVFSVPCGDPQRYERLYSSFCSSWNWQALEHRENEGGFYWGLIACAAAMQNDRERLDAYLNAYRESIEEAGRVYPLFSGDAGWIARSCGIMEDYFRNLPVREILKADF